MKLNRDGFKAKAECAFLRANPAAANLTIRWHNARRAKSPTGVEAWNGKFEATAAGHRTRVLFATGDDHFVMVR